MATQDKKLEHKTTAGKVASVGLAKPTRSGKVKRQSSVVGQDAGSGQARVSEVSAKARFVHATPRKLRLVANTLKGLDAVNALYSLRFIRRDASRPLAQLLASAMANAEHNFQIDKQDLFIKRLFVDEGPKLKRFRPRAHGSAAPLRYRMSHVSLVLGVRAGARVKSVVKQVAPDEVKIINPEEIKKGAIKTSGTEQSNVSGRKGHKGFLKGVFQRKTG